MNTLTQQMFDLARHVERQAKERAREAAAEMARRRKNTASAGRKLKTQADAAHRKNERAILAHLKHGGDKRSTIANAVGMSSESCRLMLIKLEQYGRVKSARIGNTIWWSRA